MEELSVLAALSILRNERLLQTVVRRRAPPRMHKYKKYPPLKRLQCMQIQSRDNTAPPSLPYKTKPRQIDINQSVDLADLTIVDR